MIFTEILITPKNETTKGILKEDVLIWWENRQQRSVCLADVVGVSLIPNTDIGFVVSAYPVNKVRQKRQLREYVFAAVNQEGRKRWVEAINLALGHITNRKLLVVINPTSGKKKARAIWQQVKPLFDKSHLEYQVIIPEGVKQLATIIQELDLSQFDGVVIIGGDGTVYQVVNELFKRTHTIPLGVIPGGTGNGLCKSILDKSGEIYEPLRAALVIAKGKVIPMDLMLTQQQNRRAYALLSLSWGLISDVDLESDRLRFLGVFKNDVYALLRIMNLRYYRGRLSFLSIGSQEKWQVIEDDFVLVWAMNIKWAAYNMKVAPKADFANGEMDILVVRRGVKRGQLLRAFLAIGEGKHIDLPYIEYYKANCVRLEPLTSEGILAVDGELVEYGAIELQVKGDLAQVYCLSGA